MCYKNSMKRPKGFTMCMASQRSVAEVTKVERIFCLILISAEL
jgi:hypothetical protein